MRNPVSHPETHQGRVLGYPHGKDSSNGSFFSEKESRKIKQGAHRYWRQEATALRDPQREENIVVEALYKHQASD